MTAADDPVVLVVEDDQDLARTYERWIADSYDVRVAHDGNEALERMDESVDVVLLDRRMPGLSGDEVLSSIRDDGFDVRVAMVTAVDPSLDAIALGFDAYLVKPTTMDELRETIDRLLERSTYDDLLQEYYGLVETQALLDVRLSGDARSSAEYRSLDRRIDELQDELASTLGGLAEDDDFIATLRTLKDVDDV